MSATDTKQQEVEETAKDIATAISESLHEHLADIAYQLTRIADQLELVTGEMSGRGEKRFIRVVNID